MKIILACLLTLPLFMFSCKENNKSTIDLSQKYHSDSMHCAFSYPANWEVKLKGNKLGIFEGTEEANDDFQENIILWTEDMPMQIPDEEYAKASVAEINIQNPQLKVPPPQKKKLSDKTFYHFEFDYKSSYQDEFHVQGYTLVKGSRGYNISCTSSKEKTKQHQPVFEAILKSFEAL